jgi:hypothetical protein
MYNFIPHHVKSRLLFCEKPVNTVPARRVVSEKRVHHGDTEGTELHGEKGGLGIWYRVLGIEYWVFGIWYLVLGIEKT